MNARKDMRTNVLEWRRTGGRDPRWMEPRPAAAAIGMARIGAFVGKYPMSCYLVVLVAAFVAGMATGRCL